MAFTCKTCGEQFDTLPALGGHTRTHKQRTSKKDTSTDTQAHTSIPTSTPVQAKRSRVASDTSTVHTSTNVQAHTSIPTSIPASTPASTPVQANPSVPIGDIGWIQNQLSEPLKPEEIARLQGRMDSQLTQMQQLAAQQQQALRAPPPPPDGSTYYREQGVVDKVAGSIDWNGIAQTGMGLLTEIIRERRMARQGPSMAETIGNLAIQNFAGTLAKERGRAMGKSILDNGDDDYTTNPVMQVMIQQMQERMEKESKERKDMADKWAGIELELKAAKERLANPVTIPQTEYKVAPAPAPEPPPAPPKDNVVLEIHEKPKEVEGAENE